jgi:hypothetical protein
MVILSIDVVAPGNEVGHKIGNPTNAESKTEPEPTMKPNTSTAQRQISKYSSLASIALKLF